MLSDINVSRHAKERYRQRVAKVSSSRASLYLEKAYIEGKTVDMLGDARLRRFYKDKEKEYNDSTIIKFYHNYVYVFNIEDDVTCVTVYSPNHRNIKFKNNI